MKKIDKLVLKNFVGPFILTFFIAQFVLVMQFLWKYVDDLVGKGLSTGILLELLVYASARLVPLALPLAVLLSSIMTFGAFGENYELTAVKSAGTSLLRFMRALIIGVTGIGIFAFVFSNYMLPKANLKFGALLYDIRHQKPTVALKPGIFYAGIDGFYIKVGSKDDETNTLYNITVYDHTSGHGNDHVITAEKGTMTQDEQALALTLKLENGHQYREVDPKDPKENNYEMVSTSFKSWEKRFDLSQFKLARTDESFFKDLKQMLDLNQLQHQIDTIKMDEDKLIAGHAANLHDHINLKRYNLDSLPLPKTSATDAKDIAQLLDAYNTNDRIQIMERAMTEARNVKNFTDVVAKQLEYKDRELTSYSVEVHRKFTLSVACLVLFFIGAPLGSIIRKGGLGWPLFYSVLFFILYHVTSIIGEKLTENNVLTTFGGMWLSTFILFPLGLFLTLKATQDSKLYSFDYYKQLFSRFTQKSAA